MVLSIEECRGAINGDERRNRNERVFFQETHLWLTDQANLHVFPLDYCVAIKLRDAFIEPQGKAAVIQPEVSMGIFVIESVVRKSARPPHIGAHQCVVLVIAQMIEPAQPHGILVCTVMGKEQLQGIFILQRKDDRRRSRIDAKFWIALFEHGANLLKMLSCQASLVLSSV